VPRIERDDDRAGLQRLWFDGLTALQKVGGMSEYLEVLQPDSVFDRFHESTRKVPRRLSDGLERPRRP
jgi:hypothetical protein